jgi:hypothetical protein
MSGISKSISCQIHDPSTLLPCLRIFPEWYLLPPSRQRKTSGTRLSVLADGLRRYGAPEALVTDGGGIFYSNVALQLYDMLGIRKQRIDPGEPWQDYVRRVGGFEIPAQCRGG